jgi:SnoaL-like domain
MDDTAKLLAIEQIKTVKARYFRFVDIKNWTGLRSLFCDNATLHYTDSDQGPMPLDAAMKFVVSALDDAISIHHGHMPEIDIQGPSRAAAVFAMEDQVYWPENSTNPFGILKMHGAGHYHDTFERQNGEWRIASLKLTRLRRMIELRPTRAL